MSDKKTEEYINISVEKAMSKIRNEKYKIIEQFAEAYLAETELKPSEVEFVTQEMPIENGIIEHVYFFRRKT